MKRTILIVISATLALLPLTDRLLGDEVCAVVSAGAETAGAGNSYLNVGQTAIGIASNAGVIAHIGAIHCIAAHVICKLGDMNADGFVDGEDIDAYVRVKITGMGTPYELCAANLSNAAFVALLLGP